MSPTGKSAAFLTTKNFLDETDYNRIFVIKSLQRLSHITQIVTTTSLEEEKDWDINPDSILWSNNGNDLYVQAEERACSKLWKLSLEVSWTYPKISVVPEIVTGKDKSVNLVFALSEDPKEQRLLINTSSIVEDGSFYFTNPLTRSETFLSVFELNHVLLGLQKSQISEIYFRGDGDYDVQAWVVKPSGFDSKKKYPLAFLVHGGPNGTWQNAWSTRWNPAVWAEQGYVVVLPNP